MPKKIIPTYSEISNEINLGKTQNPILDSPISTNFENELRYTINDMIDIWVRGCTNGATLWQFCQEHEKALPSSFEYGMRLLQEDIRKAELPTVALHELITNNFMLVGLFQELLDIDKK